MWLITWIHANLFSVVYLVFKVFQDIWYSHKENPSVYRHAALSCPTMASNNASSYLVPISFWSRSGCWPCLGFFYVISFYRRISRFVVFQTKLARLCFCRVRIKLPLLMCFCRSWMTPSPLLWRRLKESLTLIHVLKENKRWPKKWLPCLDGQKCQSLVISERGQLSQAILQSTCSEVYTNEHQSRDSNCNATNTGSLRTRFCHSVLVWKCRAQLILRVWSFYSHALCIFSADDWGQFLQISRAVAQIVCGQNEESMRVNRSDAQKD